MSERAQTDGAIGIAGAGRIGQAMGRLLRAAGEPVRAVASRSLAHARAAAEFIGEDIAPVAYQELPRFATRVLIAVPDDAIGAVAALLAASGARGIALHTSGAKGIDVLAVLCARGWSCGALHPIQTVATPEQGIAALPGSYFGVTAEGEALSWAEQTVDALNGRLLRINPESRALYHAAAVMASNYMVAIVDAATRLMEAAGVEQNDALRALAPILRASVENCIRMGPVAALTGPLERGDAGTIASHLAGIGRGAAEVEELYCSAGNYLIGVARRRAKPAANLGQIELLLRECRKKQND